MALPVGFQLKAHYFHWGPDNKYALKLRYVTNDTSEQPIPIDSEFPFAIRFNGTTDGRKPLHNNLPIVEYSIDSGVTWLSCPVVQVFDMNFYDLDYTKIIYDWEETY